MAGVPAPCTKLSPGTVSERPKVQLSKSCVGVEPTVGSNPTGSAKRMPANQGRSVQLVTGASWSASLGIHGWLAGTSIVGYAQLPFAGCCVFARSQEAADS